MAFSPDGRLLFVGLLNGAGHFFATRDWARSGAPIRSQDQRLTSAQFTPDGRTLVTGSADGTVMLWDVASRKPIGSPITVEADAYISTVLSPDGRFLYALPTGTAGLRLDLSPASWAQHACRIAGRQLSEREWRDAVPTAAVPQDLRLSGGLRWPGEASSCDSIACLRMAVYRTAFPIEASAEAVWDVLTDFGSYSEWNPSLPSISGELRAGSTVALTLGMPGRPSPKVKATLGDVAPGRRLTWHGNAGADWLFAGDREFLIDRQPDGTVRVTHTEDVHGALFPLFRAVMGSAIQRSHDAFNVALKERAEARAPTSSR